MAGPRRLEIEGSAWFEDRAYGRRVRANTRPDPPTLERELPRPTAHGASRSVPRLRRSRPLVSRTRGEEPLSAFQAMAADHARSCRQERQPVLIPRAHE